MEKEILKDISYGMYVISTAYNGKNVGCVVNTVTQITNGSMLFAVSVNKNNYTNEAIRHTKRFAVSVLSEQTNSEVIGKFGFFTSKDVDKFEHFQTLPVDGIPVINEQICGYMICELINVIDADTHDIFLVKMTDGKKLNPLPPMTYDYYHKVVKGTAPKTAPTFLEDQPVQTQTGKQYRCTVCGYLYDEAVEGIKFDDLPDDWVCPLCGVGKELFEEV